MASSVVRRGDTPHASFDVRIDALDAALEDSPKAAPARSPPDVPMSVDVDEAIVAMSVGDTLELQRREQALRRREAELNRKHDKLVHWALELRTYERMLAEKEASLWREEERIALEAVYRASEASRKETALNEALKKIGLEVPASAIPSLPHHEVDEPQSSLFGLRRKASVVSTRGGGDVSWDDRMSAGSAFAVPLLRTATPSLGTLSDRGDRNDAIRSTEL